MRILVFGDRFVHESRRFCTASRSLLTKIKKFVFGRRKFKCADDEHHEPFSYVCDNFESVILEDSGNASVCLVNKLKSVSMSIN